LFFLSDLGFDLDKGSQGADRRERNRDKKRKGRFDMIIAASQVVSHLMTQQDDDQDDCINKAEADHSWIAENLWSQERLGFKGELVRKEIADAPGQPHNKDRNAGEDEKKQIKPRSLCFSFLFHQSKKRRER